MEEKLKFSDYLLMCTSYNEEPTDENYKKIQKFLSALQIREFLPLKEKELVCGKVFSFLNDSFNAIGVARYLEMHKVLQGLFSYCVNMENDIGDVYSVVHSVYDSVFVYGLYDTIYTQCTKDYDRLSRMIDNTLNVMNIEKIIETANLFDQAGYDEWSKQMEEIKNTLDSETVKQLIQMTSQANGSSDELMESLTELALQTANKEMEETNKKFEKITEDLDSEKNS